MTRLLQQPFLFAWLLGLVWAAALALGLGLDRAGGQYLFSEGRPVETLSVVAYALAVLALLTWSRAPRNFRLHSALVIAFLGMRELDFHNAFTSESFMKISYYSRGADPLWGRILAGLIFLAVLAVTVTYLIRLARLRGALTARRPYALSSLAAVVLLPLSKVMDSGAREIHRQIGYDTPDGIRHWVTILEESTELAIPLIMLLAIVQYNRAAFRD
jgi:hypothetical protein